MLWGIVCWIQNAAVQLLETCRVTGLSISCYQKLKKAWCIFASIMVACILPLWEIMEPVEFKLDVSGMGWDKVYLYIKIYPPTKQRSTCAVEWHVIVTAEVFYRHFNESLFYMGRVALTSWHCWHPLSATAVTTDIYISHHGDRALKSCSLLYKFANIPCRSYFALFRCIASIEFIWTVWLLLHSRLVKYPTA